ncbi:MAG TPA: ankyrin repeat domain-containing protein [Terriglobia bacterium]|nr:ankyrin repeat domain-containing protein [Terriglobia bacterium]
MNLHNPGRARHSLIARLLIGLAVVPAGPSAAQRLPPTINTISRGCDDATAPPRAIAADDFVELTRGATQLIDRFERRPNYIRIDGSGKVTWRLSIWDWAGAGAIPTAQARALIQKARENGFWGLCARYDIDGELSHNTADIISVRIDAQVKEVYDGEHQAPRWLQDLKTEIYTLVAQYVWISGDPLKETFSATGAAFPPTDFFNLRTDTSSPKPGVTDLMRASAKGDAAEVQRLLSAGADLNAQDASGWTALMYAARNDKTSGAVAALLKAGADPNARSMMGQTALMAAAAGPDDTLRLLIAAGANINAQDRFGQSALMFAAVPPDPPGPVPLEFQSRPAAGRITLLRAAGAVDRQDAAGFSARDYIEQAARAPRGGFRTMPEGWSGDALETILDALR